MNIEKIDVKFYTANELYEKQCEGLRHIKTLPFLSVVQATEGSYDVALGHGNSNQTGENGAFIAPSQVVQNLVHHVNPKSGFMKAHWIFLDVMVNEVYSLDSLFSFPVILPAMYQGEVCSIIANVMKGHGLCLDLSEIYRLLDILIKAGKPNPRPDQLSAKITAYVQTHISEKISPLALSSYLNVSQSSLFRIFQNKFGITPANYVNRLKISYATGLLETAELSIKELAYTVGFEDEFYFSKIFKKFAGLSPSDYKKKIISERLSRFRPSDALVQKDS